MIGRHHQLNGHELQQALGVGDGQEGLACCSPRGSKVIMSLLFNMPSRLVID